VFLDDPGQALPVRRTGSLYSLFVQQANDLAVVHEVPGFQEVLITVREGRIHDNRIVVADAAIGKPVVSDHGEPLPGEDRAKLRALLDAVDLTMVPAVSVVTGSVDALSNIAFTGGRLEEVYGILRDFRQHLADNAVRCGKKFWSEHFTLSPFASE
jgi:hypothetical protein